MREGFFGLSVQLVPRCLPKLELGLRGLQLLILPQLRASGVGKRGILYEIVPSCRATILARLAKVDQVATTASDCFAPLARLVGVA